MLRILVTIALAILLASCATTHTSRTIRLNSYARNDAETFRSFQLISGSDNTPNGSLEFREMADAVGVILVSRGLTRYDTAATPAADSVVILLRWMEPEVYSHTAQRSTPVYGQTGGGYTTHTNTATVAGKPIVSQGTSYSYPTFGMVGIANSTDTAYFSAGGISLTAYEAAPIAAYNARFGQIENFEEWATANADGYTSADGKQSYSAAQIKARLTEILAEKKHLENDGVPMRQVWKLSAWDVAKRPLDPRVDYPRFLQSAAEYIGKSSKGQIEVPLN